MARVNGVDRTDAGLDLARDVAGALQRDQRTMDVALAQAGIAGDARDAGVARGSRAVGAQRQHEKHMLLGRGRELERHRRVLEAEGRHARNRSDRIGRRLPAMPFVLSSICPPAR